MTFRQPYPNAMHTFIVIVLLCIPNTLMTFALWQIVLVSWGIALLEYCFAMPANHFGAQWGLKPFQLKIMQEVITLTVFALFSVFYLKEGFRLNYLISFGCVLAAVYFAFKR